MSSSADKKERSYGLDLMRILMTVFVCGIHVLHKGGMQSTVLDEKNIKTVIVLVLEILVICAVNGFALISGYVGLNSKFRLSRIAGLYFTVSFYNTVIPIAFHFRRGYVIDKVVVLRAIFPFAYDANWYFTAYFALFFLIPFLNTAVKNIDRKHCRTAIGAMLIIFSVIPTFLNLFFSEGYDTNIFKLHRGYSALWLAVLYLIGAAIREYDLFSNVPRWSGLLVYFISVGTASGAAVYRHICQGLEFAPLAAYNSPFTVAQALGLLVFFKGLKMPDIINRLIAFIAPHSFSIYIIHTQDAFWLLWLMGRYSADGERTPLMLLAFFFIRTAQIFFICLAADMPLFYAMKLKNTLKTRKQHDN